jgi:tetratricopeptide (TPR) repeat protein
MSRIAGFTLALMLLATVGSAQDWRGNGRLMGKVIDEQGKAVEGVIVRASLPALQHGVLAEAKTDKKGEWSIDDVAEGGWELAFEGDGYMPGKGNADVDETGRSTSLRTTLKKKFDPNAFIQDEGKKADALVVQKNYAAARAVYEGIIAKVPAVTAHMQQFIARTYYLEGNPAEAAAHLKTGLAMEPANVQMKFLLVNMLLETGAIDEASQIAGTIDEAKITDPTMYVNFGVALVKKQKSTDALQYLDKAVAKFPQSADPYYYRAVTLVDLVNAQKDPKDPERIAQVAKMKADLAKFLQLAPNAPEAESARKLLEQIDK